MKKTKIFKLFRVATLLSIFSLPVLSFGQFSKEDFDLSRDVTTPPNGFTDIYFVGTGDIQLALKEGKNVSANTGLGVLFWRIWKNKVELQLDARINVASTTDSLIAIKRGNSFENVRTFGNHILVPANTGEGTFLNTLWYIEDVTDNKGILDFVDGIQVTALASNQVWRKDSIFVETGTNLEKTISTSKNVSILGLKAGMFYEFLPRELRRTKGYSIRLGANYILRSIQGDAGIRTSADFRRDLLGTDKKTYHGVEFLLSLKLKNIRAEASLPMLINGRNSPISGLSGPQFITSIGFVGGFPLSLK